MTSPSKVLVDHASKWMREASKIAMSHYDGFDQKLDVMIKSDDSPLTKADLEVDAYIHEKLKAAFPEIPIVTEEQAGTHGLDVSSGLFFLVDPIDGTKEFINKRDEFTINIALLENGAPIAGMVCAPALKRCFIGEVGKGAKEVDLASDTSKAITVSKPHNSALKVVASRSHLSPQTQAFIDANQVVDRKSAGSSLKFCLIATGEADLYPRFAPTMEWDTAAGHAVLLAAGGFVRNLDGTPLAYAKPDFKNPWFIAGANGVRYTIS